MKNADGFEIVEPPKREVNSDGFEIVQPAKAEPAPVEPPAPGAGSFSSRMMAGPAALIPQNIPPESMTPEQATRAKNDLVKTAGTVAGVATMPFTAPAAGAALTLGKLVGTGAAGGAAFSAAEEATKQLLTLSPDVKKLGWETTKGLGIGAGGGVLARGLVPAVAAGAELAPALANAGKAAVAKAFPSLGLTVAPVAETLKTAAKRAAATLLTRPSGLKPPTPSAMEAEDARRLVQDVTGQEVPIGVAEAIGTPELAQKVIGGLPNGTEFSQVDRDALKRVVAMSAARVRGIGVTADDIAKDAVGMLESELGRITPDTKKILSEAAAELHPMVDKAMRDVENAATAEIPGTVATHTTAGTALRDAVNAGLDELKPLELEAYAAAEKIADPRQVPAVLDSAKQWASKIDSQTIQAAGEDGSAGAIPSLMPEGTRKFVTGLQNAEEVGTLSQLMRLRSDVGRSIGDKDLFKGIGAGEKAQLYKALSEDIDSALNALPESGAAEAWKKAWGLTKQKAERFKGGPVEAILNDFGAEGGAGPAAIAAKLQSKDAPTVIAAIRTAAGKSQEPVVTKTIRDFLYNQAAIAGRNSATGEVSAGAILSNIESLAPEVVAEFFPGLKTVQALARREQALAGLKNAASPETISRNLISTDPALLAEALGSKPSAELTKNVSDAFAAAAKHEAEIRGTLLGLMKAKDGAGILETIQRDPLAFVRAVNDGAHGTDSIRQMMDVVSRDPMVMKQVQFQFMDDLMRKYVSADGINPAKLAADLSKASGTSGIGAARARVEAILGTPTTDTLEAAMKSMAVFDRQGRNVTAATPLIDIATLGIGDVVGGAVRKAIGVGPIGFANQLRGFVTKYPSIRYAVASKLLTDQNLRKFAMTPIGNITRTQTADIMRYVSAAIIEESAPGSPEAEQAQAMARDAGR